MSCAWTVRTEESGVAMLKPRHRPDQCPLDFLLEEQLEMEIVEFTEIDTSQGAEMFQEQKLKSLYRWLVSDYFLTGVACVADC